MVLSGSERTSLEVPSVATYLLDKLRTNTFRALGMVSTIEFHGRLSAEV